MAHDQDSAGTSSGKAASSALGSAIAYCLSCLCSDESSFGRTKEQQWKFLNQWADQEKLILSADFPQPVQSLTAEHDVRFDEKTGLWFKYTIPDYSGFTVDWDEVQLPALRMAHPLEYLHRLELQNKIFADDIRLVGLLADGGLRIVTSQPDISGEPATRVQILDGMAKHGFKPLNMPGPNGAPAFWRDNLFVWDAHPGNFVFSQGELVPIDLIITGSVS